MKHPLLFCEEIVMDTQVFVAACPDYAASDAAVARLLDAFGGAKAILGEAKRVALKPNLVLPSNPAACATTHPAVVAAVARAFVAAGAEVRICESGGGPHVLANMKNSFRACGMDAAAKDSGATVCLDLAVSGVPCPDGRVLRETQLLTSIWEADLVISLGKAKTHGLGVLSGAVKNMFGAVPGMLKPAYHGKWPDLRDFFAMIVDLCELLRPGFSIIDGVMGMEGDGPTAGVPKKLGILLGGRNPHAVDLALAQTMGLLPALVPTLREAIERGLIPASPEALSLLGDPLPRSHFLPATTHRLGGQSLFLPKFLRESLRRLAVPYPRVTETCVGCGDCVRICPKKTVEMRGQKAYVLRKNCIQCYCCHEMCKYKAISLKKKD